MGDNLTVEQKQALDALVQLVAAQQAVAPPPAAKQQPVAGQRPAQAGPPAGSALPAANNGGQLPGLLDGIQPGSLLPGNMLGILHSQMPELLETWLGIKPEETAGFINSLLSQKDALQSRFIDWAENRPLDAVFEFLVAASLAFYLAEKEVNPKIKTYIDAFYYISTSASVGYADIFAVTQTGRTIAALVMILGPALTSHALARPEEGARRSDPVPVNSVLKDRKEKPNGHAA